MTKHRYYISLLFTCVILFFPGCKNGKNLIPGLNEFKDNPVNTHPAILVQECNSLGLYLYKSLDSDYTSILEEDLDVESNALLIGCKICGDSPDGTSSDCSIPSDPVIDQQLLAQHFSVQWGDYIEYRLEEVKSIKISSNQTLFGRIPGTDLSDKFVFWGNSSGILPWITNKKEYIGLIPNGATLKEFMESKPLLFAEAFFLLHERPVEINCKPNCSFTVSIELLGGKTLQATTRPIILK